MNSLTPPQQIMLATWQQHTHAEFVLKDADAALATMTENPYVFLISSGTARVGRPAVHEFYSNHFIPNLPADLELTSLSQTFGDNRIAEEMVVRFTHSIDMDWLLPGLRPTHRRAEFVLAAIIEFEAGKVAHERLYWDQATLLSQMGVLDHPMAAAGVGSAAPKASMTTGDRVRARSSSAGILRFFAPCQPWRLLRCAIARRPYPGLSTRDEGPQLKEIVRNNWVHGPACGAHSRHLGAGTSKEGGKPHAKADRIPVDRRISWFARRGSCANAIVFERRSGI